MSGALEHMRDLCRARLEVDIATSHWIHWTAQQAQFRASAAQKGNYYSEFPTPEPPYGVPTRPENLSVGELILSVLPLMAMISELCDHEICASNVHRILEDFSHEVTLTTEIDAGCVQRPESRIVQVQARTRS